MPIELEETALPTSPAEPAATATHFGRQRPEAGGTLAPGTLLAHFRIDRLLGQGGMGQVYAATDLALDRAVAVKVLPPQVAHDPSRRQRLIREARAQARINHPNVCHIYYIGEQDGSLFFAMEYVEGHSVSELVERGPLSVDRALAIVRMTAEGLREADRRGFTHRDVKPSNLMVDHAGRVKIVDFGLVTDAPRAELGDGDVAQTGIAGTPLYMAPEQARGEPVDRRSDVYALGATLYHLIAGEPPFAAATAGELLALHSTADRPALPRRGRELRRLPVLDELCARMMAADPDARFASYDELIAELERATPAVIRPAGLVARTAAAVLDLTLVIPFFLVAGLLGYRPIVDSNLLVLPGLWLYAAIATWRFGRTIGHTLLDLEVVPARPGPRVGLGQAALRTGLYLGPLFGVTLGRELADYYGMGRLAEALSWAAAAAFLAPVAALAWVSWRWPDKRAPWDRLAGTRVVYRRLAPS